MVQSHGPVVLEENYPRETLSPDPNLQFVGSSLISILIDTLEPVRGIEETLDNVKKKHFTSIINSFQVRGPEVI